MFYFENLTPVVIAINSVYMRWLHLNTSVGLFLHLWSAIRWNGTECSCVWWMVFSQDFFPLSKVATFPVKGFWVPVFRHSAEEPTPVKSWNFWGFWSVFFFIWNTFFLPLFVHPIKGCLVFSELPCICIWVLDITNCNNIYLANYLILTNVSVTESKVLECTGTSTHPIRFRTVLG